MVCHSQWFREASLISGSVETSTSSYPSRGTLLRAHVRLPWRICPPFRCSGAASSALVAVQELAEAAGPQVLALEVVEPAERAVVRVAGPALPVQVEVAADLPNHLPDGTAHRPEPQRPAAVAAVMVAAFVAAEVDPERLVSFSSLASSCPFRASLAQSVPTCLVYARDRHRGDATRNC